MQYKHRCIESLILILIFLAVSCSSNVIAASVDKNPVEIQDIAGVTAEPEFAMVLAETPVEVISTFSVSKLSLSENLRETLTPNPDLKKPTVLASQSRFQIETPVSEFKLCSPVANIELAYLSRIISDAYRPPPPGSDDRHEGVDFSYYNLAGKKAFIAGVGIQSVLPGIVAAAITNSFPYGNFVIIETPREWLSVAMRHRLEIPEGSSLYLLYAHMKSAPKVTLGQEIKTCQQIGKVGSSGNSMVEHLHLEARRGPAGASFQWMAAFQPTVSPEERANYRLWRTSGVFVHFDPMLLFDLK